MSAVISHSAAASIAWLFEKALRDHSVAGPENECAITVRTKGTPAPEDANHRLVILNISSYAFRIVTLFDFPTDRATVAHMAKIMRRGEEMLQGQTLLDAFEEFANMVCGAVNRGLSAKFRHVGMSTPFLLENTCASYVSIFKPTEVQAIEVAVGDTVRFQVLVCICVDNQTTLDFHVEREAHVEASSGELELF